jgi:hypothetical protein
VAAFFFLQPIIRGWARYRTRLNLEFKPEADLAAAPRPRAAKPASQQLCFWSRHGVDRFAFLTGILDGFRRLGWQTQLDSGWDNHDVEIVKSRWTQLLLTTASEQVSGGRIFLRCRLEAKWSLLGRILFGSTVVAELLLIDKLVAAHPWVWMVLPLLPLLAWFLEDETRHNRLLVAAAVEDTAAALHLEGYDAGAAPGNAAGPAPAAVHEAA